MSRQFFFTFAVLEQLITLLYATAPFTSSHFIHKSSIFAFLVARQFNKIYPKTARPDYEGQLPVHISLLICLHSKILVSEARHVEPASTEVVIYTQIFCFGNVMFFLRAAKLLQAQFLLCSRL
jgi:hypothetical protein